MTKHSYVLAVAVAGTLIALGCTPPPVLKARVKKGHIASLSGSQMKGANQEKSAFETAHHRWKVEKKKLSLRRLDYKLARTWYRAAVLRTMGSLAGLPQLVRCLHARAFPERRSAALARGPR